MKKLSKKEHAIILATLGLYGVNLINKGFIPDYALLNPDLTMDEMRAIRAIVQEVSQIAH